MNELPILSASRGLHDYSVATFLKLECYMCLEKVKPRLDALFLLFCTIKSAFRYAGRCRLTESINRGKIYKYKSDETG